MKISKKEAKLDLKYSFDQLFETIKAIEYLVFR